VSSFSVRAIYLHGVESDGVSVYEERIVMFDAPDADAAGKEAENESREYLSVNPGFKRVSPFVIFRIGASLNDRGTEIWSGLSRSRLEPSGYYRHRYTSLEPQPDEAE
jgi:hypothetical protein